MSHVPQNLRHHRYAKCFSSKCCLELNFFFFFLTCMVIKWMEMGNTKISHWVAAEHLPLTVAFQQKKGPCIALLNFHVGI